LKRVTKRYVFFVIVTYKYMQSIYFLARIIISPIL